MIGYKNNPLSENAYSECGAVDFAVRVDFVWDVEGEFYTVVADLSSFFCDAGGANVLFFFQV